VSTPFRSTVGVKQGGPASPDLFNDYINELICLLDFSNKTYKLGGLQKGTMVYADDTTLVCSNLRDLEDCISIIEKYCSKYDIIINAKKTKCMIFGTIKSIEAPQVKVNGQILEIVDVFKFLGVNIDREGTFAKHIKIKKAAFFSGVTEVERFGINKQDVPLAMKSLLYTSLVRSKLVYGLEGINLSKHLQKSLKSLEAVMLKRACGMNKYSKSTSLIYAMKITPFELYIYKRKLYFILQLLANPATSELLSLGIHKTLDGVLQSIGIKKESIELGRNRYRGVIRSRVLNKLEEIKVKENLIRDTKLVTSLEFLLKNRSSENNMIIQHLIDPRRCGRG
jgi:hypothetical protein